MIFLIPIETAVRELQYKLYLAKKLCSIGHTCYIGSKSEINFLCKKFDNYIYLDKGFHDGKSQILYKIIKNRGGLIYSIDEEGGVDYQDDRILKQRYKKDLFDYADKIFFWGEYQYLTLKDKVKFDKQVLISGHPRFTLLKKNYLNIYQDEVINIKRQFSNFVLINTNMGFGNNLKGDDFVEKNYIDRFPNIKDIIDFDKQKLDCITSLCKEISEKNDINIILRPHPEENIETYKKIFVNHNNISIIFSGSVIPWLIACDILIHPDCTTAIESWILCKKSISILPENYDKALVTYIPVEVSFKPSNFNEVIDIIENKVNLPLLQNEFDLLNSRFSLEKDSIKIIIDEFRLLNLNSKSNIFFCFILYVKSLIKMFLNKIHINNNNSSVSEKKLSFFNKQTILDIMKTFPIENGSVRINSITKTLFKFKNI
jgi:surface carbohydrate biosynthesis protein